MLAGGDAGQEQLREEPVGSQLTSLAPGSLQLVARLLWEEEESALPSLLSHFLLTPPPPTLGEDFVEILQTVLRKTLSEEFRQNYYHHQTSSPGGAPQSRTGGKATVRTTISGVGGQAVNYPWEARTGWT